MKKPLLVIFWLMAAFAGRAQINDRLVAYYPFNNNGNDASGHGYNGTIGGSAVSIPDRFGYLNSAYYFFSQSSAEFSVNNLNTSLFYSACSVSFWLNATSTDNNYITVFSQNGSYHWLNAYLSWLSPYIWQLSEQFQGAPAITPEPSRWYTDGQWNNFIFTCDYKIIDAKNFLVISKAYFNGEYIGGDSALTPKFVPAQTSDLQVASSGFVCLDDIRIYNKVLSASDISILANDKPGGVAGISPVTNSHIAVYPNPATDKIYITAEARVEIYNLNGQLIKTADHVKELDVNGLKPGLYILAIQTKEGVIYQKQVIEP